MSGVRLLRALGIAPSTFHMNKGHAAFLTLELMREKIAAGKSFAEAQSLTKPECIFTTHTPVEAGHDRFRPDLLNYALQRHLGEWEDTDTDACMEAEGPEVPRVEVGGDRLPAGGAIGGAERLEAGRPLALGQDGVVTSQAPAFFTL